MKLTLLGCGVRAPMFAAAALRRASRIGLSELCLFDIDPQRLHVFGQICVELGRQLAPAVLVRDSIDINDAVAGAEHVVLAVRVGGEAARVRDERACLARGVLGQETTGAAGFAMALRSIPVALTYAQAVFTANPSAWMYVFTNPAGIVTQALRDAGYDRTVGICDSANLAAPAAAALLGVPTDEIRAEVFGLNHLSWTRRVSYRGRDVLPTMLTHRMVRSTSRQRMFGEDLVAHTGMWLNEYLYYYYYPEQALTAMRVAPHTRGEDVSRLTSDLIARLTAVDSLRGSERLELFFQYQRQRRDSYMSAALSADSRDSLQAGLAFARRESEGEGYAGLMLEVLTALNGGPSITPAVNVPSAGAIPGFIDTQVLEVTCRVDASGITPLPQDPLPPAQRDLISTIKEYEVRTVAAVSARSRRHAVDALMIHPLVRSYPTARNLVQEFLSADTSGEWT